jgi:hypothetical protein
MDQNQNNSTVKDNKHSLVCKRESLQLNLSDRSVEEVDSLSLKHIQRVRMKSFVVGK